uniref:Gb protein n=1 Tax=Solanum tuberosum TaxID=4113 RepID=M1CAU0_SOLTU
MGTREVYEEKLKRGNLHHDPTIKPGLGCARCPRCLSLLNSNSKSGEWVITPVLHDFTAVAGSGIGGLLSAIHGFNTGRIPFVQRHVKGPKWLPFVIGLPSLLMFSAASATFGDRKPPGIGGRGRGRGGRDEGAVGRQAKDIGRGMEDAGAKGRGKG